MSRPAFRSLSISQCPFKATPRPSLGAWAYTRGGWLSSMWLGVALPALALICYATERNTGMAILGCR
jgi:hypothetical protein